MSFVLVHAMTAITGPLRPVSDAAWSRDGRMVAIPVADRRSNPIADRVLGMLLTVMATFVPTMTLGSTRYGCPQYAFGSTTKNHRGPSRT